MQKSKYKMKVGDLVTVKERKTSIATAKDYFGHAGVIFEIREKRGEVFIFINNKLASFLPQHLEVINVA